MTTKPDIICIGSLLWDVIGKSAATMRIGHDVPGHIIRIPGGVAMNVAMAAKRFGLRPAVLSAIGQDAAGEELLAQSRALGLDVDHVYRSVDDPTDQYMAIEAAGTLIAAIADAHSLERAGAAILAPLFDLATPATPVIVDGNLTETLLTDLATAPEYAALDLRIVPASPGKARRLLPFVLASRATLYLNLIEANIILDADHQTSAGAAAALVAKGAHRVLITDGPKAATDANAQDLISATPEPVPVARVTGAGDTFLAGHITAEMQQGTRAATLAEALHQAGRYVAGSD